MHFALPSSSPLPSSYDVVACGNCGFVFADTPGSQADYARHYTEFSLYEDRVHASGSGSSSEDKQRFAAMASLIGQYFPRTARVLDVGCGNGGLLLALRCHGFTNLVGMDPSAACASRLDELDLCGVQGTLESFPESIGRFDLIVLSHVMEHLLHPLGALGVVREMLTGDGKVYLETPDASRYEAYPFVPFYFFDSEHINHFDRTALANLATAAGFEVDRVATKEIPVAGGQAYPAVYMLAGGKAAPRVDRLAKTDELRTAVANYITASTTRAQEFAAIADELEPSAPLALWGAGSFAQRFVELPWLKKRRILAVVDRDPRKQGLQFAGCTIAAPEEGLRELPSDTMVMILVALDPESAVHEYLELGLPYRFRSCSRLDADLLAKYDSENPAIIAPNGCMPK